MSLLLKNNNSNSEKKPSYVETNIFQDSTVLME